MSAIINEEIIEINVLEHDADPIEIKSEEEITVKMKVDFEQYKSISWSEELAFQIKTDIVRCRLKSFEPFGSGAQYGHFTDSMTFDINAPTLRGSASLDFDMPEMEKEDGDKPTNAVLMMEANMEKHFTSQFKFAVGKRRLILRRGYSFTVCKCIHM